MFSHECNIGWTGEVSLYGELCGLSVVVLLVLMIKSREGVMGHRS